MQFDLRLPLGLMFSIFGLILTTVGVTTNGSEIYKKSLNINVNLWWGLALLAFGVAMLLLAVLGKKRTAAAQSKISHPVDTH